MISKQKLAFFTKLLKLAQAGKTNEEIAKTLRIKVTSVPGYKAAACRQGLVKATYPKNNSNGKLVQGKVKGKYRVIATPGGNVTIPSKSLAFMTKTGLVVKF